jgi:hypothetical protein
VRYQDILYEVEDAVATITLSRLAKRNAYTIEMGDEVVAAFAAARDNGWAFGPGDEISGNTVAMAPDNDAIGIVVKGETGSMDLDVVANRVTSVAYRKGIELSGGGISQARIVNNLVTGTGLEGVGISASGGGTGTSFSIVDNTVTENTSGILVNFANGEVVNNVITGNTAVPFYVTNSNTVVHRNNLFFDNGVSLVATGPNTLFTDPLYVDTQAFRPASHSRWWTRGTTRLYRPRSPPTSTATRASTGRWTSAPTRCRRPRPRSVPARCCSRSRRVPRFGGGASPTHAHLERPLV